MSRAHAPEIVAAEPMELLPRSMGDIFDEAFDLYKRNFALFAGVAAAVHVPAAVTMSVLTLQMGLGRAPMTSDDEVARMFGMLGILFALYGVYLILGLVEGAAMSAAASDAILGRRTSIGDAYRRAGAVALPLIATWLLIGVAMLAVTTVLFVMSAFFVGLFAGAAAGGAGEPSVILAVILIIIMVVMPAAVAFLGCVSLGGFVSQIAVIERTSFVAAIARNINLLAGRYFQIMGGFLLLVTIFAALWIGLQLSVEAILDMLIYPWLHPSLVAQRAFSSVASALITLALHPYVIAVITLIYYDQRVRREAFDLALMERKLEAARGSASA